MIAARFRLVGWVAGCAGAALLCYMASQSVAAERSALAKVDGEIATTKIDIGRLETEITARSRAGQVEKWNSVLALQAARPGQYASSGVQLASLAGGRKLPLDPAIVASHGAVATVAYQPAATPNVAIPVAAVVAAPKPAPVLQAVAEHPAVHVQPLLHEASYIRPKPSPLGDDGATLVRTSYEKPMAARPVDTGMAPIKPEKAKPAKAKLADAKPKPATALADPAPAKPKLKLAKALDDGLLPSDLGKLIAAERKPKSTKRPS
jgi:hypothetical protein